jgi:tetratricopeptide (TPR) repeat protein
MKPALHLGITSILLLGLITCQPRPKEAPYTPTAILVCGTAETDTAWFSSGKKAQLFDGLGNLHFPITTTHPEVQRYFDQGLMLATGFNHAEAARSFFEATRLDSTCAMAYWGLSYVLGPNYNAGMDPDNYVRAYESIQKAISLASNGTPKEKALIDAMAKRYPANAVVDRAPNDVAYADAMKKVHEQFPDDADIGALYAESAMDLHPWDLFEKDGTAKSWTPEILSLLETLLKKCPQHITLHHLYIHAVEASTQPERGIQSAVLLDKEAPNSSHLVHMGAHIYIRTGDYHSGSIANQKAVIVDSIYLTGSYAQGAFPLAYLPHNYHFLAATATFEGNYKWAIEAAEKMAEITKKGVLAKPAWATLQHYYTIPYFVAAKFDKWDYIVDRVKNDTLSLPYPKAIRHYALGLALAANNKLEEATAELDHLKALSKDPDIHALTIWSINSLGSVLQIASLVLEADILARQSDFKTSEQLLKSAIQLEDALNYNEPPDWIFPVRHYLGALYLKNQKYKEAELVYKTDLSLFPMNGWALKGLASAQQQLEKQSEAKATQDLLVKAWKWSDHPLNL